MWQCVTVSATSEGGQQFLGVFVWRGVGADSIYGLTLDEITGNPYLCFYYFCTYRTRLTPAKINRAL